MTTTTRRIPRFHDKLRASLEAAGLPADIDPYVDGQAFALDPSVILQWEYTPGRYAKAFARTDAHRREHLDARLIVSMCMEDARKTARDPRYTQEARHNAGQMAEILDGWLNRQAVSHA
jgi:hypothetical protein